MFMALAWKHWGLSSAQQSLPPAHSTPIPGSPAQGRPLTGQERGPCPTVLGAWAASHHRYLLHLVRSQVRLGPPHLGRPRVLCAPHRRTITSLPGLQDTACWGGGQRAGEGSEGLTLSSPSLSLSHCGGREREGDSAPHSTQHGTRDAGCRAGTRAAGGSGSPTP